MELTYDSVNKEQSRLETDRAEVESLKALCCDLAYPDRVASWEWTKASSGILPKGKHYKRQIERLYDPTANQSFDIWSSGIYGHWMPKDISWFAEQLADRKLKDSKNVIKWLQETDEHMRFTLNQSGGVGSDNNYYAQKLWSIKDQGCIGDSFMFIDEADDDSGKLTIMTPHPNQFWVRRDFWGRIVVIHHKTEYAAEQLVDEFGEDALNDDQKYNYHNSEGGKDAKITVIHGTYKNKDYVPGQVGVKNMLWQHIYINTTGKHKILQTGTDTLNPVPGSLCRPTGKTYGRGIVAQMLIEILTVNFQAKTMSLASQTAVQPPMLISSAIRHKLKLDPGAVTTASSKENQGLKMGDLIARLVDSSGYPFGVENHERWTKAVKERFGVDLFLSLNKLGETGYKNIPHVNMIRAESAVLMAPVLSVMSSITDLEFDRIYNLELESGRAPEVPLEVLESQNGRIDIQYIGPLPQLLKQYYETGNLLNTIYNIREVMSLFPDSSIVVDGDELMRKILRSGNSPEELILEPREVMEIKAILAQQEEEERQVELAAKAAKALPDLGKKIESDSLLSELAA